MINQASNKNDIAIESDSVEMLKQRQADAIEALSILLNVCKAENIQFFLLAGTCLGAIRNQGMIPWDDDIDVGVKFNEYERLQAVLPDALAGTGFEYCDNQIAHDFPRMYGKILKDGYGVIDIFRLVPVSNSSLVQNIQWYQKRFWSGLRARSLWHPREFTNKRKKVSYFIKQAVFLPFIKIFSLEHITKSLEKIEYRYINMEKPKYYSTFYGVYSAKKEMLYAEWLEDPIWVTFENMECPIVSDPDAYLKKLYGDYMTPPSKDNRIAKHLFFKFK